MSPVQYKPNFKRHTSYSNTWHSSSLGLIQRASSRYSRAEKTGRGYDYFQACKRKPHPKDVWGAKLCGFEPYWYFWVLSCSLLGRRQTSFSTITSSVLQIRGTSHNAELPFNPRKTRAHVNPTSNPDIDSRHHVKYSLEHCFRGFAPGTRLKIHAGRRWGTFWFPSSCHHSVRIDVASLCRVD